MPRCMKVEHFEAAKTERDETEDEEDQRDGFKAKEQAKSAYVAICNGVHDTIDESGEPVLFSVQSAKQQRCKSRRQG